MAEPATKPTTLEEFLRWDDGTETHYELIASDGQYAELHRRVGAQWITEILRGADARFALTTVGIEIPFADLYEGIALGEDGG